MIEEDNSLFLSEMNNVSPLKKQNKMPQYQQEMLKKQAQATVKSVKKRQQAQTESDEMESNIMLSHISQVHSHESIMFHQKGIRLQDVSKLKKGAFTNQAELDLHGYTAEEAYSAITEFIFRAYQEKLRYVRIVHGKGYNSEAQFPVLKNLVNQTLRNLTPILAFCSTPEKEGGTGAVNILIKNVTTQLTPKIRHFCVKN